MTSGRPSAWAFPKTVVIAPVPNSYAGTLTFYDSQNSQSLLLFPQSSTNDFRVNLSLVSASLDAGERLLVAMSDRLSHGLLLCDRAEVELQGERVAKARQAFAGAARIAEALDCKSDSDLRRRLAALAAMIGEPS